MDYEKLFIQLPKYPQLWTEDDTQQWLAVTGLKEYQYLFKSNQIDGKILTYINDQDLIKIGFEAQTQSFNQLKQWLQCGLYEYIEFVKNKLIQENEEQRKSMTLNYLANSRGEQQQNSFSFQSQNYYNNNFDKTKTLFKPQVRFEENENSLSSISNIQPISQLAQLMTSDNLYDLYLTDSCANKQYQFKQQEITFGRDQRQSLSFMEDTISRLHCRIFFDDAKNFYYIQDLGSTSGTFILLQNPTLLQEDLILQLGSFQYKIEKIQIYGQKCNVQIKHLDGENIGRAFTFELQMDRSVFIMGRQQQFLQSDNSLSAVHAQFSFTADGLIVQDVGSRNGTWLRLSMPQQKSEPIRIVNGRQFRLGFERPFLCSFDQN